VEVTAGVAARGRRPSQNDAIDADPRANQPPDSTRIRGLRRAFSARVKSLRASVVLTSLARIASAFSIPQPGESLPGSSPALSGAPAPGPAPAAPGRLAAPGRPLRRSLNAAVAEGAFAEVFGACATGAVITGWALYLGASAALIGLLGALPLGAQVASLPAAWFTSSRSRKAVALWAVGISRMTFLPLLALPTLDATPATKLHLFLAIVAISTVASVIGNTAWAAWMGDLVPERLRGRFFGRRTIFLSIAGTLTSIGAAILLDRLAPLGWTGAALSGLTAAACLAGVASVSLMLRQHEPHAAAEPNVPAWQALRLALRDRRARPFLGYLLAWNAAVGISASFFAYHMLTNLKTGFLVVAAHGVGVAVVRILSARFWGHAVDRIGAGPVLIFCSFGIAAVPLTWFFVTPERLWPIAVDAGFAAFLWAGHGIAAFDLTIGLAPRASRPIYLAAFATAGGLGFGAASIAAGQLAALIPLHFELLGEVWTNLHVLFLLSAIGRLASAGLSLRLHDPGARGTVPELVAALADRLGIGVVRPYLPVLARIHRR
jgi:Major Facilitator Superfamily